MGSVCKVWGEGAAPAGLKGSAVGECGLLCLVLGAGLGVRVGGVGEHRELGQGDRGVCVLWFCGSCWGGVQRGWDSRVKGLGGEGLGGWKALTLGLSEVGDQKPGIQLKFNRILLQEATGDCAPHISSNLFEPVGERVAAQRQLQEYFRVSG